MIAPSSATIFPYAACTNYPAIKHDSDDGKTERTVIALYGRVHRTCKHVDMGNDDDGTSTCVYVHGWTPYGFVRLEKETDPLQLQDLLERKVRRKLRLPEQYL